MLHLCLPDEISVDYSYVLAVKASPPDVEMARLVALRSGGASASVWAACVTVQAPFIAFSLWYDHNSLQCAQCACSGKAPVLLTVSLSISIAVGNK